MKMSHRTGYTLIELMATIGLSSAVLTLLAGWLTAAMHHQSAAGQHLLNVSSQERLARQFREDVHGAREFRPLDRQAEPDVQLRLEVSDEKEICYRISGRIVERTEQIAGQVARREQYRISPASVRFEHNDSAPAMTTMWFHPDEQQTSQPAVRVDAVLGSDLRFERRAP